MTLLASARNAAVSGALSVALLFLNIATFPPAQAAEGDESIDFNRNIRPILADKCFACHGPDKGQRQGGDPDQGGLRFDRQKDALADLGGYRAIVPGKPDESALVERIFSRDPDEAMPPPTHRKQLTETEKQLLKQWIQQGAKWSDHWSLIPPKRAALPTVNRGDWPRSMPDYFILAKMEKAGFAPSPDADKRTLLRRLSFDLTGLPPTREQMETYLIDTSDKAFERAVERLLNSPHYGERMAAYWSDLVRYADTVGYHGDQPISVSPYRDYVIEAFNDNMPFDQFTREQLAGDLLPNPTPSQLVASGYNRLGMMSAEGGVQPKEYLAKYAADRVRTASTVWLASTLGCAECHDHKYDPFHSSDFYRFAAFFSDIKERGLYSGGNFGEKMTVPDRDLPARLAPIDKQLGQLRAELNKTTPELLAAEKKWIATQRNQLDSWRVAKPEKVEAADTKTRLSIQKDQSVLASGSNPAVNTYRISFRPPSEAVTGLSIEVLPHDSLPKKGPGRAGNGNFVLSEVQLLWHAEGGQPHPIELAQARATFEQKAAAGQNPYKGWTASSAVDKDVKGKSWGWAILPKTGQKHEIIITLAKPFQQTGSGWLTVVLAQNHTNPRHTLGRFRLRTTSAAEVPGPQGAGQIPTEIATLLRTPDATLSADQKEQLSQYHRSIASELSAARSKIAALIKQREELQRKHSRTTLITVRVEPRETRVLPRGNWMDDSGAVVKPGVPHFLGQIETAGRANRLDLANWITSPDNPLTARVFVNRLWKLYFGTGLSKDPADLGVQGEWPSHPELLDTLAIEFIESNWDVKHMVRLLVTSHTYRQSSLPRAELAQRDPFNRLLARQSRFRMDAEMIRDNALAVSGLLNRSIGGRSVKPYQPPGLYRHLNFPRRTYKADSGPDQYRRGVYTHWQRQFLHPAMKTFDAPAREECAAERPRSNTPLAALLLLNDPTYVEAARAFAERAIREGGSQTNERLNWLFVQALGRPINDREREILSSLLNQHLKHYQQQAEQAKQLVSTGQSKPDPAIPVTELAAWTSVARSVFNMHEFINRN